MEKNADKKDKGLKNTKYCSPKNINNPTLFNKKTLILLIDTWNASKASKDSHKCYGKRSPVLRCH